VPVDIDVFALLRAILRRWLPISVLMLLAGMTGYGATYLMRTTFEATSRVLLHPESQVTLDGKGNMKELLNFPLASQTKDTQKLLANTYAEVIKTQALATQIVDALRLHEPLPPGWLFREFPWLKPAIDWVRDLVGDIRDYLLYGRTFGKLSDHQQAVEDYLKNIEVTSIVDSYVIEITYFGRTPQEAADVANMTAQLFLATVAGMNSKENIGSLQFLTRQLAESNDALNRAREALRVFKAENRTVDFKEETTETIKLISALESKFEQARSDLAGHKAGQRLLSGDIDKVTAERDYLEASLEKRRSELSRLSAMETALGTLELNLETAKQTHQYLSTEYEKARILRTKEVRELRVASDASAPRAPAKPKRIFFGGAAAAVAMILGIYLFGMAELMNTKLRSIQEVESALGLKVLATIPVAKTTSTYRASSTTTSAVRRAARS